MNMMKWKIGMALVLILTILNTASAGVQIEEVGKYTASGGGSDIAVSDSYAYMLGDKLYIIDISTPSRPIKVGECSVSGSDIAIKGYAYVVGSDGMYAVDISNPYNPVKVGQCNNITGYHMAVYGNHAYISGGWDKGLRIVDISDPSNPTKIGEYNETSGGEIAASEDYVYVADSNIEGLIIIDVSDPSNPQKIAQISGIGGDDIAYREISGAWRSWNYVYLLGHEIYVIDVSYPSEPRIVGVSDLIWGDGEPFAVGENFAYVSNSEVHGWSVHDISDPSNPEGFTGRCLVPEGFRRDIAAYFDYAFATSSEGLTIFKVVETGRIHISSSKSGADVYVDGEYKHTMPEFAYSTGFDLPVGEHTIKLTKSGYNDWETTIFVDANEYVEVSATLTPEPGSISISSVPAGAKIYLDGAYKGTTPKTISDVSVGYHTLELNKEGYQSWSLSVYVTSGDTKAVSASMSAIPVVATPTIIPVVSPTPISTPAFTPTPTPISALVDSDGDGVPDQYDYAPYDPNVQTESDIIPEATPTPKPPGFDVILAISGLLTIAYFLRRRKNEGK
ncbi:MAG: hypothetical protein DRP91_09465 [Candidatus Neomarinimicrobiota bacterium]|nr:MAG: hypothetical protein DRP91_09465 [Candidatus Neomarinimicrobiota bacterium]